MRPLKNLVGFFILFLPGLFTVLYAVAAWSMSQGIDWYIPLTIGDIRSLLVLGSIGVVAGPLILISRDA